MKFESQEDAFRYYNSYARQNGFGTRKHSTRKSQLTSDVIGHRFCCSRQGSRNTKKPDEEKQKVRGDLRTCCKALVAIKKTNEGKWVVSQVMEEHNHEMTTLSKTHNYRCHRNISASQAEMIKNMRLARIKTNLMMNFIAIEVGGSFNVGFQTQDVRNFLSSRHQKQLHNGDAEVVLDYLKKQQLDNPSLFYSIQADSEGHMINFFWADARSRVDYHYFEDVVCFDPTYLTNKYEMPFAPIIGVNHHYQVILFGGALFLDETEDSFAWVMAAWMKAMGGKQPKVILTDQESTISGAITRVIPQARHCFCLWHIMRNALTNVPHVFNTHKEFRNDFNRCLYEGEAVEDFESNWEHMLEK